MLNLKMPKIYLPEFYIRNTLLSFLGLIILAFILTFILENFYQTYQYIGITFAILIAILGAILIGYFNASSALKDKSSNSRYVHIFLITLLLITDLIWGESSLLITLLRNLAYFLFLELGSFIHMKKTR